MRPWNKWIYIKHKNIFKLSLPVFHSDANLHESTTDRCGNSLPVFQSDANLHELTTDRSRATQSTWVDHIPLWEQFACVPERRQSTWVDHKPLWDNFQYCEAKWSLGWFEQIIFELPDRVLIHLHCDDSLFNCIYFWMQSICIYIWTSYVLWQVNKWTISHSSI